VSAVIRILIVLPDLSKAAFQSSQARCMTLTQLRINLLSDGMGAITETIWVPEIIQIVS